MGYSVYVRLNKAEQEKVRAFLELPRVEKLLGELPCRYVRMNDLSYADPKDADNTYCGADYGGSYEAGAAAHAFCIWLCQRLGKPKYVYDGGEMFDAVGAPWLTAWTGTRTKLGVVLYRGIRRSLKRICEKLTVEWNEYISTRKTK